MTSTDLGTRASLLLESPLSSIPCGGIGLADGLLVYPGRLRIWLWSLGEVTGASVTMHDLSNSKIHIWIYYSVDNSLVGQSYAADLVTILDHYLPSVLGQA